MGLLNSVSYVAVNSALDSLALRQRAIADNVANLQTPGYRARVVEFEAELSRAVGQGSGAADATIRRSSAATQLNGNNVNLDEQTLLNVETNLRYQLATQAASGQFSSVRAAMRTS
ncbi:MULTISPECIES: flagellar basal body rod protein FlgB [Cellulomonas]|uniref:Flagellar basal body rod protein FlgB n=1 Tax=Cellulomonas gilvus (strain ATCC 13127 / NRRL B-14078) TaxID=593907 RepID=F8A5F9_CELGA|nr:MULTISPECIES: flagellar basal body protein [Cellulomonas]AEI10976.1 flagellar basal body rod protein [Cellulomonas gilvus ATCC 13127]MCR6688175.1 flagellar basal body protein [Cellulomonas sp.]